VYQVGINKGRTLYVFRTVSPSIIRSLRLYIYLMSPQAYVNQKLQIQLRFLMMSDIMLETCRTI